MLSVQAYLVGRHRREMSYRTVQAYSGNPEAASIGDAYTKRR
jgi:hypothetical protein